MSDTSSSLDYDVKEQVAIIRIQRPHVRNALDTTTLAALVDLVDKVNDDAEVRAIVLTGGPDAFCAGEDLVAAGELTEDQFVQQIHDFQRLATALRDSPKPTIAAIGGPAVGGGIEIAVNCDARIAGTNAYMLCPELQWGLTITNGASVLMRRLVGDGWARELCLFGRTIDAKTALQIGLVTRLVEPSELEQAAWEMARAVTDFSTDALKLTKTLVNADPTTWQATLDAETRAVTAGFGSVEVQHRIAGFPQRHQS